MTVPTISNLPTVPATSDPNFETEAPALFNHIKNTFVSEMNSAISFINSSTFDATVEFKNASFTAAKNFLYMIDTTGGAVTVTLPASPATGDQLLLMDQKRYFATNNLTISRNGKNINGAASNVVSKSTGALIRCVYNSTYGWTVDLYEGQWESGTSAGDLVYNGGKVGIGTSGPVDVLHIKNDTDATLRLENGSTNNDAGIEFVNVNSLKWKLNKPSGHDLQLTNNAGDYVMTWKQNTGKVGIGTSDPDAKLDIDIGASNADGLLVTSSNDALVTGDHIKAVSGRGSTDAYNLLNLENSTGTQMIVRGDGNVGIGTSSPDAKLEVESPSGAGNTNLFRLIRDGGYGDTTFNQWYTDGAGTPSGSNPTALYGLNMGLVVGSANNGKVAVRLESQGGSNTIDDSIVFRTANSDKVFIKSSGNVGIGTSSPSGVYKLSVENTSGGSIGILSKTSDSNSASLKVENSTGSTSLFEYQNKFTVRKNSTDAMVIDSSGNIEVSTGNLVIGTAGKGIDFSANSHFGGTGGGTGMSSELLNSYEEGTFTPTVSGTWTTNPTTLSGKYTKIGRMVYIQVEMTGGVKSSAISGYLTGLPIAVASSGTGSVTNVDVQDLGNCLFANTDRIWFTATNLGTAKIYITGQYIAS